MVKIAVVLPCPAFTPVGGNKIIYEYINRTIKLDKNFYFDIYYDNSIALSNNFLRKNIKNFVSKIYPFWRWFKFDKYVTENIRHISVLNLNPSFLKNYDLIIVTSVETAIKVKNFILPQKKFYFIQHYENWTVSENILHNTYKYDDFINIVVSRWLKKKVEKVGGHVDLYLPNAIDYNKFYIEIKPEEKNPYALGMMYHELKWKGSIEAIVALNLIKKQYPNLNVLMFGKFSPPKNLPNWIKYYKNASQERLREIYNNCAIFLSPSYKEGFGLPPAEAMACGCAVVATKSGGVEDFCIDEETALLCESPPNPKEIADKIFYFIENNILRIRIAYNGYNFIRKYFLWNKNLNKLTNTIKGIINEK
jgi:glycosyltransferase involved in cell wall biosynthesis